MHSGYSFDESLLTNWVILFNYQYFCIDIAPKLYALCVMQKYGRFTYNANGKCPNLMHYEIYAL